MKPMKPLKPMKPMKKTLSLLVFSFYLLVFLSGCGEHEGTFSFAGTAIYRLECTLPTQSISEQDFGYILELDTPEEIGADYYDADGNVHHNCVILYRTHTQLGENDKVSGRMYLDDDYSKAICTYHYSKLGLPEGVCERLD